MGGSLGVWMDGCIDRVWEEAAMEECGNKSVVDVMECGHTCGSEGLCGYLWQ